MLISRKLDQTPSWKCFPKISSGCDTGILWKYLVWKDDLYGQTFNTTNRNYIELICFKETLWNNKASEHFRLWGKKWKKKSEKKRGVLIEMVIRGWNNAQSSDMTEHICHLISHKYSQFQVLSGHILKKKFKI